VTSSEQRQYDRTVSTFMRIAARKSRKTTKWTRKATVAARLYNSVAVATGGQR